MYTLQRCCLIPACCTRRSCAARLRTQPGSASDDTDDDAHARGCATAPAVPAPQSPQLHAAGARAWATWCCTECPTQSCMFACRHSRASQRVQRSGQLRLLRLHHCCRDPERSGWPVGCCLVRRQTWRRRPCYFALPQSPQSLSQPLQRFAAVHPSRRSALGRNGPPPALLACFIHCQCCEKLACKRSELVGASGLYCEPAVAQRPWASCAPDRRLMELNCCKFSHTACS